MALVLADRIKETTTTTGTGTYTLAGAVTGFESFATIGNTNTTYYCCTDGDDFEVGVGTYASSGTTLARTTILQSSNSDNAVNWSAGTRSIFCTQPAEKAVFLDGSNNISIPGTIDGRDLATDGTKLDGIEANATADQTAAEIRTLVESATDSNVFTDADHTKLNGIEANADVTDTTNVTAAGALMDSEVTNLSQVKAFDSSDFATAAQGSTADAAMPKAGGTFTGDVTLTDTDAGSGSGPLLTLTRDSSSPADNDLLGGFRFKGDNDAGENIEYARIDAKLLDNTDGQEDGGMLLSVMHGGSSASNRITLQGYGDTVIQNRDLRLNGVNLKFEGATADAHETTLTGTDPTADRTITLPDATGTVQLTDGSGASLTSLNASELGSGTVPNARLDAQLQDVAGLAVTNGNFIVGDGSNFVAESGSTARTSLGLGTAAVLDTGISNTNVPKFTSGVADNDFLRVDGTAIEGRSASEVLSDIAAMPLAGGAFTGDVTFTGDNYNVVFDKSDDSLKFADNAAIKLGTGDDFSMLHNGSNTVFHDAGTGGFVLRASQHTFKNQAGTETNAQFTQNGAVELYHDNSKKLETTSGGIDVTGEVAATSLDISGDVDVDGTLEADAMTLNGTAITTTATLSTGISNGNVPVFTSGVADNDFLRVNGTSIEGRSTSELASDIGAATTDDATALAIALG